MDKGTRALSTNGEKDPKVEEGDDVDLEKDESTIYRGLAARLNFLSLDCPDLQFGSKPSSREMSKPGMGSCKCMKRIARHLLNREGVVGVYEL